MSSIYKKILGDLDDERLEWHELKRQFGHMNIDSGTKRALPAKIAIRGPTKWAAADKTAKRVPTTWTPLIKS